MPDRSAERWVAQLPSTASIKDQEVRAFLDTLKSAWELRSGDTGASEDARFITKGEFESQTARALGRILSGEAGGGGGGGPGGPGTGVVGPSNRQLIDGLATWVINSDLYQRLNTRIQNLEVPWDTVNRVNALVANMRSQIGNISALLGFTGNFPPGVTTFTGWVSGTATSLTALSATVAGQGSSIVTLQQTTASQASSITSLQTTTGNLSSSVASLQQTTASQATSITNLQTTTTNLSSSVTTLQQTTASQATSISNLQTQTNTNTSNISTLQTTTANQATSITNLQTTQTSQGNRLNTVEGQITQINQIDVNSTSSAAQNIFMMRSTLASGSGPMGRIYWSDDAPAGTNFVRGDRWVDTNSSPLYQVQYWNGSAWSATVTSFKDYVDSGITTEQNTRSSRDNALARVVNSLWAIVNNGSTGAYSGSIIEDGTLAQAGAVAASASRWGSLQSAVLGPNGNQNLVAQVRQDFDTYVNADNGRAQSTYTVRVNANGNVAGFGIQATYNTNTGAMGAQGATSAFGVVADSFWIAAPGQAAVGSGQVDPEKVPFVALTSGQYIDGKYYPPGVWIRSARIANATIDGAQIGNAQINTLRLAGNAVTVSTYDSSDVFGTVGSPYYLTTTRVETCTAYITVSGLDSGETAGTIIVGFMTLYEQGGSAATIVQEIYINNVLNTQSGCTLGESKTLTSTGYVALPNGTHTISLRIACGDGYTSSLVMFGSLIVMSGKR